MEAVDDDLRALMDDMLETMYDAPGIGLAAIQVGVPKRVIVMDLAAARTSPRPRAISSIRRSSGPRKRPRPTRRAASRCRRSIDEVERPARVRLRYLDYDGEAVEEEAEGLFAVCIQHEMDHLEGVLFIDHLSRLKRDRAVSKVRKAAKEAA